MRGAGKEKANPVVLRYATPQQYPFFVWSTDGGSDSDASCQPPKRSRKTRIGISDLRHCAGGLQSREQGKPLRVFLVSDKRGWDVALVSIPCHGESGAR